MDVLVWAAVIISAVFVVSLTWRFFYDWHEYKRWKRKL